MNTTSATVRITAFFAAVAVTAVLAACAPVPGPGGYGPAPSAAFNAADFDIDLSALPDEDSPLPTANDPELLDADDVPLLADLSQVMRDASICGLGQAAPNPVDSVLRFFPHEVNA